MKRRLAFLAVAALSSIALAAAAQAKGPSQATIEGPGLDQGITFAGNGEPGSSSGLGTVAEGSGLFPALFGQTPDPMLRSRPNGELGPRYTLTYRVPGPDKTFGIRQDLYPYAKGGPVTYTPPGQPIYDTTSRGGWYRAGPELKPLLVRRGLPSSPPTVGADDGSSWISEPWGVTLVAAAAAALLAAASIAVLRRRPRPAGA